VHRCFGDPEVLRDLRPGDLSFPGECDHDAAELFGVGLGHDVHLSSQDQILAGSVVNQPWAVPQDLDAARAANRDLITRLNSPSSHR